MYRSTTKYKVKVLFDNTCNYSAAISEVDKKRIGYKMQNT